VSSKVGEPLAAPDTWIHPEANRIFCNILDREALWPCDVAAILRRVQGAACVHVASFLLPFDQLAAALACTASVWKGMPFQTRHEHLASVV